MGRPNTVSKRIAKPGTSTASDRDTSRNPVQQKPLPLGSGARMNARVVFAVAVVALSLWTARGFLPPLIWATILAVTLWPLYIKFAARLTSGPTRLAAVAFTAIVALILFTPMALAIYQVAEQSGDIANWLKKARESGIEVPDWIARLPVVAEIVQQWWRDNLSDPKAATAWLKTINADDASGLFNTFGGQLMRRLFMLFFSLFALFVLLSNGRSVANRTIETCDRILGHPGEGVVQKIVDSIRGTVNGTVIVAIGEGLLIGVGYLCRRTKCRDVYHHNHGFCDAPIRCLGSVHGRRRDAFVRRWQRDRGRRRLFLGRDRHACRGSLCVANSGRGRGSAPFPLCVRRNFRGAGCVRPTRFVFRTSHHGRTIDGLARVDFSS